MDAIEKGIKEKIEAIGTPLLEWDINIYRGILTGLNAAFIISGKKKDELIARDPKSAEIIRPVLRGRDVFRYKYKFCNYYMITTFPSLRIDINMYPAIKEHLLSFDIRRLEQSGNIHHVGNRVIKSRKRTSNKWYETQDTIAYWEEFYKQKIAYNDINSRLSFSFVDAGIMLINTIYFITNNDHMLFLLGILNSKLIDWYYRQISAQLGKNAVRMFSIYVYKIPIPVLEPTKEEVFSRLVSKYLEDKGNLSDLEQEINISVSNLYKLSSKEQSYL
ncbi:MAG: TaqI-like C-terminal specificity domain-containing protein, partial [Anaerolineaceae bacterium]